MFKFRFKNFSFKNVFHKKGQENVPTINSNIILLLFLGLLTRIFLANFGTLHLDQGTFIAWGQGLARGGFENFYSGWSDYLPGYLYVLYLLTKLQEVVVVPSVVLFKLPAILADIGTAYLIYVIVKKFKGDNWGLISSSLYLFNPAILGNSTLWGQVDSLTALFSTLAVYFASSVFTKNKFTFILSAIFLAVGTIVKPQAALATFPILFLMLKDKWRYEKILLYGLIGAVVFVLGFVPFLGNKDLLVFILERVGATTNQYPYTSVNAFNFWGIFGMWEKDNVGVVTPQVIGYILTLVSIAGFLGWSVKKGKHKEDLFEYNLLSVCLLSMYIFFTRMHERHMMPALAPLAISLAGTPMLIVPYVGLSFAYVANLRFAFVWITEKFRSIFSTNTVSLFSLSTVVMLLTIIFPIPKSFFEKINWKQKIVDTKFNFPNLTIEKKYRRVILGLILTFALFSRLLFLDSPKSEYFDEVYHAFTARQMMHGNPNAWDWLGSPPEGFAYEWTHPPFAKLAMWASMVVFGENAFVWRLPGAISGTLIIFMIYLLAKEIFKDEIVGLLSALVLSLDGLALVMSRIGMNDSYFLLFALTSIYFFIKDKNVISAAFLGFAAASKWTTLWVLPILFVAHFVFKKKDGETIPKMRFSYLAFLVIPFFIYMSTYIPFFASNHTWSQFFNSEALECIGLESCHKPFGLQQQMWWYHTNLVATHAYSSNPLTWPFLIRPIYLYTSNEINGMVSRIYAMGNPIVFWAGIVSVFVASYESLRNKNKKLGFVVFSYFALFLPWAASPRIMFLYHYLPAVPFLAISTGFVLRKWPKNIWAYMLLASVVFVYFYPHWTGIKIPLWLDSSYYWLNSWR